MEGNYKRLIEFISRISGISIEEIERKIEAKQAKLAGLISREGAAQIIAAELNVNFDKQIIKISQIVPGMRKINLIGKIINLFPIRSYNKNNRQGRIGSFILADETSNIRIVLWDENHIDLIDKGNITQDCIVEISNASVRNGEIHLSSFSEINISNKSINNVVIEKPSFQKSVIDFNPSDNVSARAFIVQMFEPRFFEVCPSCRKKVVDLECQEHGKVIPEKRALLNFVIDDGSDSIRATMFSDVLEKIIPREQLEDFEAFAKKKQDLLGKEMLVTGQVRKNQMYNNNEFIVSGLDEIDLDKVIEELEK
jgi:replication factor A1